MSDRSCSAVVLAAGHGSRMRSLRPKPLHLLCGKPLLWYVLDALGDVVLDRTVVVVGQGAERVTKRVQEELADPGIDFVEQASPRGTGEALAVALAALGDDDFGDDDLIVLPGDMPLLAPATLAALLAAHRSTDGAVTVLTGRIADPDRRPRVVRGRDAQVSRVVAHGDLVDDEHDITEVSASVYCFRRSVVGPALRRLSTDNVDGEFRLPDVVEVLHRAGYGVGSVEVDDAAELAEVDDRLHLAEIEAEIRRRINERWLASGVTMVDPATCYVDATVVLGRDVTLFPNTLLQGRTIVGEGAEIGPDTRLVDCVVGRSAEVQKTFGTDAEIGADAIVGPFVALEPGAQVPAGTRVAPFTTVRMTDET
jgi:bifunctional UDP-N-acetylglucosamine pyrophosphorylase/glucosamine-1-phosphate N-acetyltransferase